MSVHQLILLNEEILLNFLFSPDRIAYDTNIGIDVDRWDEIEIGVQAIDRIDQ